MYQATFKRLKADLHPLPQVPFISPLLPSRRIIAFFFTFFGPSSSFVSFAAIDTHPARCAFWDMHVMHPGRLSCPFKEMRGGLSACHYEACLLNPKEPTGLSMNPDWTWQRGTELWPGMRGSKWDNSGSTGWVSIWIMQIPPSGKRGHKKKMGGVGWRSSLSTYFF